MTWVNYPENTPTESGYYFTRYFNPEHNAELYKALWYDVTAGLWSGPWRWNYDYGETKVIDGREFRPIIWKGIDVKTYNPLSRTEYYTQCECTKEFEEDI